VLTNRPGRGPLTFECLAHKRKDLIHVQISGRGNGGSAVDYTVNASVGFPQVTGTPDSGPVNHVLPAWDIACGLYASSAVLAAVYRRSSANSPQRITVAWRINCVRNRPPSPLSALFARDVSVVTRPESAESFGREPG
jgi:2-methylfumaryl-CoA isomerase